MSCWDLEQTEVNPKSIKLVSAVVLVDADGRVLIAERPKEKAMAGYWEFPGGKVEEGETSEQALIRELKEELGIETRTSCLAPLGFVSTHHDEFYGLVHFYVCRIWEGIPQPLENQKLQWVRPSDFKDYNILPANQDILPYIRTFV